MSQAPASTYKQPKFTWLLKLLGWVILPAGRLGAFGLFLFVLSLVFVIPAALSKHNDDYLHRTYIPATATVVSQQRYGGRDFRSELTLQYSDNTGTTQDAHITIRSTGELLGSQQGVLYNPTQPSHAVLASEKLSERLTAFNIWASLMFLAVTIFVLGLLVTGIKRLFKH